MGRADGDGRDASRCPCSGYDRGGLLVGIGAITDVWYNGEAEAVGRHIAGDGTGSRSAGKAAQADEAGDEGRVLRNFV